MSDDGSYVWLYAVTADPVAEPVTDAGGVARGQVRVIRAAGLAAIGEDVSDGEFGETALRRNLEDLDWLERTARAHHAVIAALARLGPVVPMRLATVYSSDRNVAEMLQQRAGDLHEALGHVQARSEWGVKAFAAEPEPGAVPEAAPGTTGGARPGAAGPGASGPGAAYLQRRRAQLTAQRSGQQQAMASAQVVHAELSQLAVSARLYPPQSPDLAGHPARMVLNAAYLVADGQADQFAAAVTGLTVRHRAVRLALTGPWPPYSFVGEPEAAEPQ